MEKFMGWVLIKLIILVIYKFILDDFILKRCISICFGIRDGFVVFVLF